MQSFPLYVEALNVVTTQPIFLPFGSYLLRCSCEVLDASSILGFISNVVLHIKASERWKDLVPPFSSLIAYPDNWLTFLLSIVGLDFRILGLASYSSLF